MFRQAIAIIKGSQLPEETAPLDDGNDLLQHVGVKLECIKKSYVFLDAFVGCFITILQTCSVQQSRPSILVMKPHPIMLYEYMEIIALHCGIYTKPVNALVVH
jgi:hypothetical protein